MQEITYSPESRLRKPLELFKEMIRDFFASRELAYRLFVRNIRAQYRQSLLGIFWAFIPSLATAIVFILAQKSRVIQVGPTDLPYAAYVMIGITLWQTFVEALNGPIQIMTAERAMISKQNLVIEGLILSKLAEVFFNFGVRSIIVLGFLLWIKVPIHWTVIFAPLALLNLVLFGTFLGLLLAPINVLYRDISKGLTIFTGFWLLLTPIIYPQPRIGAFSQVVRLNPVTPLLVTARELVTRDHLTQVTGFVIVSCISIAGIVVAWIVLRLSMPYIVERMN